MSKEKQWITIEPARADGSTKRLIDEFESYNFDTRIRNGRLEVAITPSTPRDIAQAYRKSALAAISN